MYTLDDFGKARSEYVHHKLCASPPLTTSKGGKDGKREKHREQYTTQHI